MPKIDYQHPDYVRLLPQWQLIQDCIDGEAVVKGRGDKYLPRPNATDTSPENRSRYDQYVLRAVFYGATARTLQGLTGQIMAEAPKADLPKLLDDMDTNMDGTGLTLTQQGGELVSRVIAKGRGGLLVDYPTVDGPTTMKDLHDGKVRPTISLYEPESIINWRTTTIGGVSMLSLVVLAEQYVFKDDGFEPTYAPQWRVLRLDAENGNQYTVEIWVKDGSDGKSGDFKLKDGTEPIVPLDASGSPMQYIPFIFVGPKSNDPAYVVPPLLDMANLNLAHYRNSADYEEACYITGQPTPFFSGLTQEWVDSVMKGVVHLGSRAAVLLPEGGNAGLLQAEANSMPKEAMEQKERQMVALGARLVEQRTVQRTATEASGDQATETSFLGQVAVNVGQAYALAMQYANAFVEANGKEAEVNIQFNTNFNARSMTSHERAQLASEWTMGAITDKEMRAALRRTGVAYLSDEEWQQARSEEEMTKALTGGDMGGDGEGDGQQPGTDTGNSSVKSTPSK